MKYLLAINGITDHSFGILANPKMGIPEGVKNGMIWAADVGAYSGPSYIKRFNKDIALPWLKSMEPYKTRCLWVTVPDVVENAEETSRIFSDMADLIGDWPLAYVAQDGQENWMLPLRKWVCLFIGGSTSWKISDAVTELIKRGQELNKLIHIGRVNNWKRYNHFSKILGSESFTCDGTKQRFVGVEKVVKLWGSYMNKTQKKEKVYMSEISLQEIEAILAENIRVLKVVVKEKRVRTLLKDRLKADPAFAAEYRANINAKAKARRDAKKAELLRLKALVDNGTPSAA